MMPNKSNPDALELLRGECNGLLAAHQQVVLTLKGLPSGYNRDLQCVKPVLHQAVSTAENVIELVTVFMEQVDFDRQSLRASLQQGDVGATLDMEAMIGSGVAMREAHHRRATASTDPQAAPQTSSQLSCEAYRTLGSAHPQETQRVARKLLAGLEATSPR